MNFNKVKHKNLLCIERVEVDKSVSTANFTILPSEVMKL